MHAATVLLVALICFSSQTIVLSFLGSGSNLKATITGRINIKPIKRDHNSLAASTCHVPEAVIFNGILGTILSSRPQSTLTTAGILHATALGTALWTLLDFQGWLVCVFYFAFGSLATKVKMIEKEKLGIAEKRHGARGPENVWGSAATATMCAVGSGMFPEYASVFRIGYVASLASKLSDTLGSELGKAYGENTYLITTLKAVPRGTEGAVSLEGTLAGVLGSMAIAVFASALKVIPAGPLPVLICTTAALVATTAESFIGATLQGEQRPWLSNEVVNFVMTLIGALTAMGCATVLNR